MDINKLIKGLKTHVDTGDCGDCPFKDDPYCIDNLVEETIKALEEKNNG